MRNIRLEIEYDGTRYNGWQVQRRNKKDSSRLRLRTIQETIEGTLQRILQEKIRLIVSGRTDSGVHAEAQVANFKTKSPIELWKLQKALNALLPKDISISKVENASLGFNSRFNAKSKTYRYTILNSTSPSALLKNYAYFYPHPLNVRLMRKEAEVLLGRHDFKSFCATGSRIKDTFRTIKNIDIKVLSPSTGNHSEISSFTGYRGTAFVRTTHSCSMKTVPTNAKGVIIFIYIEANGFLYNMARNIVGSLLEIGRGKFAQGSLKKILAAKDRRLCGPLVPARGLCLIKVKY